MAENRQYHLKLHTEISSVPFESTEEAWFWFIQAQDARNSGARFFAGGGKMPRPCEPLDILNIIIFIVFLILLPP